VNHFLVLCAAALVLTGCAATQSEPATGPTSPSIVFNFEADSARRPREAAAASNELPHYWAKFRTTVLNRWYDLIDTRGKPGYRVGKVILRCNLHSDGTVSEIAVIENTVDLPLALLCQSAIRDSTPFDPLPPEMRSHSGRLLIEARFRYE